MRVETVIEPDVEPTDSLIEAGLVRLGAALVDAGYLWAEVELDTSWSGDGVAVGYRAKPGNPALVGGWFVEGNESIPTGVLTAVLPRPGGRFGRALLERTTRSLQDAAAARGYPLCRVAVRRVRVEEQRVFPVLAVAEGDRVRVMRLTFAGSGGTSPMVLARSAGFRPGLVYLPARIRSLERNLEASGLVAVVGHELFRAESGYGLRLKVRSRRANGAAGAFGYAPDPPQLNGLVELNLRNLMNAGRRLKASWRAVAGRAEYGLSYTEPWLMGQWLSVTAGARIRVADTSMSRTELDLTAVLDPGPDVAVTLGAGYEQLAALDPSLSARTTWAGTGVALDSRDGAVSPTRGQALRVMTRVGQRRRAGRSRLVSRVEADGEIAGPNWWRLTFDNRLHYRLIHTPDTLADEELVRVGGATTLRGYREEEFRVLQAGWWNAELRYDLRADAAGYPFFDLGLLRDRDGWQVRPGYGAGVRFGTRLGTFRLDYGLGWNDRPLDGKVHLGFEGEF